MGNATIVRSAWSADVSTSRVRTLSISKASPAEVGARVCIECPVVERATEVRSSPITMLF
jgi:hypothetical protein